MNSSLPPAAYRHRTPLTSSRMGGDAAISASLSFAVFGYALSQTLVFPALSTIQSDLGADAALGAWIVSGFLLSSAILTPVLGSLGDAHGPRRILLLTLLLTAAGGTGAAFAPDTPVLIAARVVQGVSLGILPLSFAIVRRSVAESNQPGISGLLAGIGGAGAGVGLVVGGLLADLFSWRSLFGLGAILAVLAWLAVLAAVPRDMPRSSAHRAARFDLAGAVVLGIGLVTLLIGLTQGSSWGWSSGGVWALIAAGILVLIALGPIEARSPAPLVDVGELRDRALLATHLTALLIGAISFPFYLLLPLWAQAPVAQHDTGSVGFGGTITLAGLLLLPGAITLLIGSTLTAPLARRSGARAPLLLGFSTIAAASLALAAWHTQIWQHALLYAVVGLGTGFVFASQPRLIAARVPVGRTGAANGVNNIARSIGSILATQVTAAIVAATVGEAAITEQTLVAGLVLTALLAAAGVVLTPLTGGAGHTGVRA